MKKILVLYGVNLNLCGHRRYIQRPLREVVTRCFPQPTLSPAGREKG